MLLSNNLSNWDIMGGYRMLHDLTLYSTLEIAFFLDRHQHTKNNIPGIATIIDIRQGTKKWGSKPTGPSIRCNVKNTNCEATAIVPPNLSQRQAMPKARALKTMMASPTYVMRVTSSTAYGSAKSVVTQFKP